LTLLYLVMNLRMMHFFGKRRMVSASGMNRPARTLALNKTVYRAGKNLLAQTNGEIKRADTDLFFRYKLPGLYR
jgi:hypothetical protein